MAANSFEKNPTFDQKYTDIHIFDTYSSHNFRFLRELGLFLFGIDQNRNGFRVVDLNYFINFGLSLRKEFLLQSLTGKFCYVKLFSV